MILLTVLAHADVGPAPKCPEGTHSQYLYGRHCPRDGFHMEAQPDGGVIEVADGATAPTPPTEPPMVPPATDPPTTVPEVLPAANPPSTVAEVPPPPAATPPAAPPPAKWCSTSATSSGVLLMFAGLVAGWIRRRA